MKPFPQDVTDEQILNFVDGWAALLEAEDYQAAYDYTEHDPAMQWTPDLMREVIKNYGYAEPSPRVTVAVVPTDTPQRKTPQRKNVERWPINCLGNIGYVWYDLNINGKVSDLTATLDLHQTTEGITVLLEEIHVM